MMGDQRDEISFNLNSPGQLKPVQELTLDDLNDEDLKVNDQYWRSSNKNGENNIKHIDIFEIKQNHNQQDKYNNKGKTYAQRNQELSYPMNSDLRKYQPNENQPRTINFDTATFENSLDGDGSESGLGESNQSRPPLGKNKFAKSQKQNEQSNNLAQFSQSQDSDFDLSDTKLRRLGIINSLKKDAQDYSNLLNNYSKQFKDSNSDSTRLSEQPTSHNAGSYMVNNSFSNNNLHTRENSRNAFDKYGYMLQREGNLQQQQSASFLTSNLHSNQQSNNNRDIQDRMTSINYKIREAYHEFSNTKDPTGFAPSSSQNSASDPYRISINSFKNSLFSGQKENNSYLPNNLNSQVPQSSMGGMMREEKLANLSSYNNFQHSSLYNNQGMDSDTIMRSALQAHHLATSGYKNIDQQNQKPPKNHPVSNLNKVFGETGNMFNEFKKRSTSVTGTQDDDTRSTNKQTNHSTLTTAHQPTSTISFEPTPFQKYMDAKKKYYDTFLPEKDKIMNNPLKLLKFKMQQRDTQTLENCKSTLKYIDEEISNNVDPELANSVYSKTQNQQSIMQSSIYKV